MKVLVTGGSGMLGRQVVEVLKARKIPFTAPTHSQMDITDPGSVWRWFISNEPDVVIHCAAWTQVDRAESQIQDCMTVNALGTQHITTATRFAGAKLLYVSTDYVFGDGEPGVPHEKDEIPNPLSIYGLSKLQGEYAVRSLLSKWFIVRVSWLYDPNERGFVRSILNAAAQGQRLRVVSDQTGAPTWVKDLAPALVDLAMTEDYGYHAVVPRGSCSWNEFARTILRLKGMRNRVEPVTAAEWGAPARRPACSLMAPTVSLRDWREAIRDALEGVPLPENAVLPNE